MALPAVMSYCKVSYQLLEAVADTSGDLDELPQGNPLVGAQISFSAAPSAIKTSAPPATTIPRRIDCLTDASGYLYNPAGTTLDGDGNAVKRGVYILASDDPDIEPHDWTWSVAIRGDGFSTITGSFVATSGGDIDLSTVVQVPASGGQVTPEWIAAVSATESARDLAVEAAAHPSDPAVAALIDDPDSEVRAALSSTYVSQVIRKLYAPAASIIPQPQRAFPELHDSPPIWSGSATHLITGGVEVPILQAAAWHSTMRLVSKVAGSLTVQAADGGEGGLAWGAALLTWEWISDAPALAIRGNFRANPLSLMVDGKLASLVPYATPGAEFARIRWGGERKLRHYRLTGSSAQIQGIVVGPTDSIWPYPITTRPMVGWCGDSYAQGEPDAALHWRGIPHIAAAVMGVNLALSAEGGSGYAIGTSGGTNTFVSRLAAFAARQDLSAMVWAGGRNDPTTAGVLQAAAEACFEGFAEDHPGVPQIALGPWSPSTSWQTTYANQYTQIEAAADVCGVTFVDTRDWITGNGYVGATTGSGNADILMDSTAHPTAPAGREYLGVRVGLAIADALQKGL